MTQRRPNAGKKTKNLNKEETSLQQSCLPCVTRLLGTAHTLKKKNFFFHLFLLVVD